MEKSSGLIGRLKLCGWSFWQCGLFQEFLANLKVSPYFVNEGFPVCEYLRFCGLFLIVEEPRMLNVCLLERHGDRLEFEDTMVERKKVYMMYIISLGR